MRAVAAFTIPLPNAAPDLQRRRHSTAARQARRLLYSVCAGGDGYPFVFEAVRDAAPLLARGSPHLYVHIPFCRTICAYCPYTKVLFRPDRYGRYEVVLKQELEHYLSQPGIPPVESLYFGGGTPSLAPHLVGDVIAMVQPKLAERAQIGVEVHPHDADPETLARLRAAGVDRVSLGIESFNSATLRTLGRGYTAEQAEQAVVNAVAAGFACVDVNLMYAIPDQDPRDTVRDLRRCIALGVDHLSAYPLITFAHTRLGRRTWMRGSSYGARKRASVQQEIAEVCLASGFVRTSVWSFARTPASSYSTVTRESYRGFGAGAGSKIDNLFWFNTFSVSAYSRLQAPRPAIAMCTSAEFQRLHWFYWQVYRTTIDGARYRELFGRSLTRDFCMVMRLMEALGWLAKDGERWRVTEQGAIWTHRVQMLFSLTYIEDVWQCCQQEAWPERIVLS